MNKNEDHVRTPVDGAVDTKESSYATFLVKGLLYLAALAAWFFIGGFISVGPRIAHNIEKAVGDFVLGGTFLTWAVLPITLLVSLLAPAKATFGALGINIICWFAFLAALYIRWNLAYP